MQFVEEYQIRTTCLESKPGQTFQPIQNWSKKMSVFVQISVWCCSFSLAVSVGAALLLPISTISNEVNSSCFFQCSGSESGSTYFWDSRLRFRIRILLSSSKNSKKNLDSYSSWLLWGFLSLKNDVLQMYLQKAKKLFYKLVFCWSLEGQWRK